MKVLRATQLQKEALDGYKNGNNVLKFVKDGNDDWIVGLNVLSNSVFSSIHDDLNALEQVDYVKPSIEV